MIAAMEAEARGYDEKAAEADAEAQAAKEKRAEIEKGLVD